MTTPSDDSQSDRVQQIMRRAFRVHGEGQATNVARPSKRAARARQTQARPERVTRMAAVRALLADTRLSFHQSIAPLARALEHTAQALADARAELLRRGGVAAGDAALVRPFVPGSLLGGLAPEAGPHYISTPNRSGVDAQFTQRQRNRETDKDRDRDKDR
jgi:hypothetical protein